MENQNNLSTKRKRLSLDVFQEKSIGDSSQLDFNGGQEASIGVSIIVVSIILITTLSSDSAKCCD